MAELAPRGWYFNASAEEFDTAFRAQLGRLSGDIEAKLGWLAGSP